MNDLSRKTVKELREIAKGLCIVGRWDMTKQQLLDAIEQSDFNETNNNDCIIKDYNSIQSEGSQKVSRTTSDYIDNIEKGTLVAFKRNLSKNIAMSGKFVCFDENGKVVVESKKGTKFTINKENIIWVKTGIRWPKWVFDMFNKNVKEEEVDNAISKV